LKKKFFLLLSLAFIIVAACNFPLWSSSSQSPGSGTPLSMFRTQIPRNVNFPTKIPTIVLQPSAPILGDLEDYYVYAAQSGDTLAVVARHFGVEPAQISSQDSIPNAGFIQPGKKLIIPKTLTDFYYSDVLLPDSEVIYSPTARNFNVAQFVNSSGGYLRSYQQLVNGEVLSGSQIVERVAQNTSTNPRLLLAVIELRSHWVTQTPSEPYWAHPLDLGYKEYEGLYLELAVAARLINTGYYSWRTGEMTELIFSDGSSARIAPNLNAGTVGIQYLMAQLYDKPSWETMTYGPENIIAIHKGFFGDPNLRASTIEPMFNEGLTQPPLELPFAPGQPWALTGGLHYGWTAGTPLGALDFAPITGERACVVSRVWVLASAPGTVIHAANNMVIIGLENENGESTGWEIMYMHIAKFEMISAGTHVNLDDPIGHPSCEGGSATGTHVHITRKYKGEWIGATEPLPFILSGWQAVPGAKIFQSTLVKDSQIIYARQNATLESRIQR
jgi:LysM repeat protein